MCEPATIMAGTSAAIAIGGAVANYVSGENQAAANKRSALSDQQFQDAQIGLREQQVQDATAVGMMNADRQARQAEALAKVAAGESGVAGVSVDMLLNNLERQRLEFRQNAKRNLGNQLDQLQAAKLGAAAQAAARIAGVPGGNPFALGAQIGSTALDFGSFAYDRLKKPSSNKGYPTGGD